MKAVKELRAWERNPRTITDAKRSILVKTLTEFGDLSGVVYNLKNKALVGGHQRADVMAEGKIEITKKFAKPTKNGTVARGYIEYKGEKYGYREVSWDDKRHAAASVAANKGAGEWDLPGLRELLSELDESKFDVSLTGFDMDELNAMLGALGEDKGMDYSALDGGSVDGKINDLTAGVRKAIVIDFELDDYPEAAELVGMFRAKGVYLGGILLQALRKAKKNL